MVGVAGDGTWSHVVRDIEDIVARALASLHLGDRPFAQPPDHGGSMLNVPGRSRRLRWWRGLPVVDYGRRERGGRSSHGNNGRNLDSGVATVGFDSGLPEGGLGKDPSFGAPAATGDVLRVRCCDYDGSQLARGVGSRAHRQLGGEDHDGRVGGCGSRSFDE